MVTLFLRERFGRYKETDGRLQGTAKRRGGNAWSLALAAVVPGAARRCHFGFMLSSWCNFASFWVSVRGKVGERTNAGVRGRKEASGVGRNWLRF